MSNSSSSSSSSSTKIAFDVPENNNSETSAAVRLPGKSLPGKTRKSFIQEFEPVVDVSQGKQSESESERQSENGGFKRDMKFVMHSRSASPMNSIGKQLCALGGNGSEGKEVEGGTHLTGEVEVEGK